MVRVVVGEEDLGQLDEPDRRAQELPLGAFAAVEQDAVAAPPDQSAGEAAASCRDGAGSAEEHKIEVHGPSVGGRRTQVWAREVRNPVR